MFEWLRRLHYLINRRKIEDELRREMEAHREMMHQPRRFGNTLRLREESRDIWGWNWLDDLWGDCRYAVRRLAQSPGFALFSAAILGIGIGAGTFMFGIVNLASQPLTVTRGEELRQFALTTRGGRSTNSAFIVPGFSYSVYQDIRKSTTTFSDVLCSNTDDAVAGSGDTARRVSAQLVSGNYFRTIGAAPLIGRVITEDDDRADAPPVAVLKYPLWQRLFAGSAAVLGRTMLVNGTPFVIVGVLPKSYSDSRPGGLDDLKVPMAHYSTLRRGRAPLADPRNWNACAIAGRLRPGVSEEQARQETYALVAQTYRSTQGNNNGRELDFRLVTIPPPQEIGSDVVQGLMMMALVAAILLIEFANLTGLLLARASARRHEIATRLALGAGRVRVLRQLLTENIVLSGLGGIAGIGLAYLLEAYLNATTTADLEVVFNARALLFTAGLSVLAGVLVGLSPALSTSRIDLNTMMNQAHTRGRTHLRFGRVLMAVQVGLSLLLLISAGLFIRTQLDSGNTAIAFHTDRLLTFQVDPAMSANNSRQTRVFLQSAVQRLEAMPGVESASIASATLVAHPGASTVCIPLNGKDARIATHTLAPRFFETLGAGLTAGRDLQWSDGPGSPDVLLVNDTFARTFFSGSPLGQSLGLQPCATGAQKQATIVGVVPDLRYGARSFNAQPAIFLPIDSQPPREMTVLIRTAANPSALIPAVRRAMSEIDPTVSIYEVQTVDEQIKKESAFNRFLAGILVAAGLVALLVASLGIYGTLSHSVVQRTQELGIRMALGAKPPAVIKMVMSECLVPAAIGLSTGLIAAVPLTRFLSSTVFEISARNNPEAVIAGAVCLFVAAAFAAFVPAWRASRIDPMSSLRTPVMPRRLDRAEKSSSETKPARF